MEQFVTQADELAVKANEVAVAARRAAKREKDA